MAVVRSMVTVLFLHMVESSIAQSPPPSANVDLRPMKPLALQLARQHLLSLERVEQAKTSPDWFPERDECYIEYCNHYEELRSSLCCPAQAKNGFRTSHCSEGTCNVADSQQVQRCKSAAIHRGVGTYFRNMFSPSCGGISEAKQAMVLHNGNHSGREVHSTWQCHYPNGKCLHNHELGSPEKIQDCIVAKDYTRLAANFIIDLNCFDMAYMVKCDSNLNTTPFNPFRTCTNDLNLLKGECHLGCAEGYPYEYCKLELDPIGIFNMTDGTIDTCSLHTECTSEYDGATSMLCSSHQTLSYLESQRERLALPNVSAADHSKQRPQLQSQGSKWLSLVLWVTVVVVGTSLLVMLILMLCSSALPAKRKDLTFSRDLSVGTPCRVGSNHGLDKMVGDEMQAIAI